MTSFGYCRGKGNNGTFIWGDASTEGAAMHVVGQMHWAVELGDVKLTHSNTSGNFLAMRDRSSDERKTWPFDDDSKEDNDQLGDDFEHMFGGDEQEEEDPD